MLLLQDKLFKGHQMSIFNQMLYVNVCSAIVSFGGMLSPAVHLHSIDRCKLCTRCISPMPSGNFKLQLICKELKPCWPLHDSKAALAHGTCQQQLVNCVHETSWYAGLVAGGQLGAALMFVSAHPDTLLLILLLSLSATLGVFI